MSVRATGLIWERTRAKGSNLLMLLAIGDYSHDDGRWAWPSARRLAWKTRLTGRGGALVLEKLVADGEVWPEWNADERRLYLQVRCVADWAAYQTEGPPPAPREKISRSQREKFSLKLVALATRKAKSAAPKVKSAAAKEKTAAASLCSGSVSDPSGIPEQGPAGDPPPVHPVENRPDRAGAARRDRAHEDAAENIRVITKIVHEVLDLFAAADDIAESEVVETVKRHCAVLDIAYDSAVVWRALDSALVQRQRIGKPSLRARAG